MNHNSTRRNQGTYLLPTEFCGLVLLMLRTDVGIRSKLTGFNFFCRFFELNFRRRTRDHVLPSCVFCSFGCSCCESVFSLSRNILEFFEYSFTRICLFIFIFSKCILISFFLSF